MVEIGVLPWLHDKRSDHMSENYSRYVITCHVCGAGYDKYSSDGRSCTCAQDQRIRDANKRRYRRAKEEREQAAANYERAIQLLQRIAAQDLELLKVRGEATSLLRDLGRL